MRFHYYFLLFSRFVGFCFLFGSLCRDCFFYYFRSFLSNYFIFRYFRSCRSCSFHAFNFFLLCCIGIFTRTAYFTFRSCGIFCFNFNSRSLFFFICTFLFFRRLLWLGRSSFFGFLSFSFLGCGNYFVSVSCVRYLPTMRGAAPEKWTMHCSRGILSTSASSSSGRPSDWYDD